MTSEELARMCDESEAKGADSIVLLVPGHGSKDIRRVAPKLYGRIVSRGPKGDFVNVKIKKARRVLRILRDNGRHGAG